MSAFLSTEPAYYWIVFVLALLIFLAAAAVPVFAWIEELTEKRDRETWSRMPGATR